MTDIKYQVITSDDTENIELIADWYLTHLAAFRTINVKY